MAALYGHPECVSILIANGARVNWRSSKVANSHSLLQISIVKSVCFKQKYGGDGETALMSAVTGGHPECVSILIANGANVNLTSSTGKVIGGAANTPIQSSSYEI